MRYNANIFKTFFLFTFSFLALFAHSQKDIYKDCPTTFEQVFALRCPDEKTLVGKFSRDQLIVSDEYFINGSYSLKLGGRCGDPVAKALAQYRQRDESNWAYLRNLSCTHQAGWIEVKEGICDAGGPPPICPVKDHWVKVDPQQAITKFKARMKKTYEERLQLLGNMISSCTKEWRRGTIESFNVEYRDASDLIFELKKVYPLKVKEYENKFEKPLKQLKTDFDNQLNNGRSDPKKLEQFINLLAQQKERILSEKSDIVQAANKSSTKDESVTAEVGRSLTSNTKNETPATEINGNSREAISQAAEIMKQEAEKKRLEELEQIRTRMTEELENKQRQYAAFSSGVSEAVLSIFDMAEQNRLRRKKQNEHAKTQDEFIRLKSLIENSNGHLTDCSSCHGQGSERCIDCRGQGYKVCNICGGNPEKTCRVCSGSGKTSLGTCASCFGRGIEKCSYCKVKGKNSCNICNATGQRFCAHCKGTGKTFIIDNTPVNEPESGYSDNITTTAPLVQENIEPNTYLLTETAGTASLMHPKVNTPASEIEIETYDGNKFKLSSYRGTKVLLVFWSSVSSFSIAEYKKHISNDSYRFKNVLVVGVALEVLKSSWEKAINENDLIGVNISELKGRHTNISHAFEVKDIPTVILIDEKGMIRQYAELGANVLF